MSSRDDVPGLGEKLKAARELAGLTLTVAATAAGKYAGDLSKFENNIKTPTLATLYKLAAAYEVNVCDLLPGGMYNGKPVPPVAEVEPEKKPKGKKK